MNNRAVEKYKREMYEILRKRNITGRRENPMAEYAPVFVYPVKKIRNLSSSL